MGNFCPGVTRGATRKEAGGKGRVEEWRLRRLEEADRQRQALGDRHLGLGDFQALVEPLSKDRDRNLDNHVLGDTDKIKPDSKLKNKVGLNCNVE